MSVWRLRDYHDDDLDQAIRIWDESREPGSLEPVFPVAEVVAAARSGQPAVVAEVGDEIVGMTVAQTQGDRAWVLLVALGSHWRQRGIGSALVAELERRLRSVGVRRISAIIADGATGSAAFENSGYLRRDGLVYYEMVDRLGPDQTNALTELGGRLLPHGLWQALAGMEREKDIIERRIVLPLAHPDVADRYGVRPPKAVILFGPPGTGKTSFAKAVASRLGWPFVELFPSRLAATATGGLAASLRETFAEFAELDELVLFIDEVEEIAAARSGTATNVELGVTNELLKLIPAFREYDSRLLVCATNSIRSLDSAFMRPGRFDYILPIGPPDPPARKAIWARYLSPVHDAIDLVRLVAATELFTPADIEFAARKGAQAAFEREVLHNKGQPANTDDFIAAISDTRPTLTTEILTQFEQDNERYTRM
ncbi:ATP-binding protein [Antrihabitans stalactiti]|uniref:GNAT family N-acetyltransferase n=1 Tax=Antrihabitans stalactiti TaxID=2584121 RepID=A0A848KFL1_9NOCA|nr:GNAT family N-acetyltransferase [Antrihabitans stalactiti]NMN94727.1 GNAT family N-acetyltransferase [Antrihabitans stalactiti]